VSTGGENDLMQRLAQHSAFAMVPADAFSAALDPARYTGRSEAQVGEFLEDYLEPVLARAAALAAPVAAEEVRV
jgi:adenylosuccinate lyase